MTREEFTPFLIFDPDAWTQSVYGLEHAFSGPDTVALFRGDRMLTFSRDEDSWILIEAGLCIRCSTPAELLCARPGQGN